jgi:hypothetical protein
MASLINKSAIRKYILDYAASTRAHPFTRVSPEIYAAAEERLRSFLRNIVRYQPSVGKTVRP